MRGILAQCGTYAAYQRHTKQGETVDELCRLAAKEYLRNRHSQRMRENPEKMRKQNRERAARRRVVDLEGERQRIRNSRYQRLYGLTSADWTTRFAAQGCGCACCGRTSLRSVRGWHVDHDHSTGAVRGILCPSCNWLLGLLGDSLVRVTVRTEQLLQYLRTQEVGTPPAGCPGMPTRKLDDETAMPPPCRHPDHAPHSQMVYAPGTYEHECPACGQTRRFRVDNGLLESSVAPLRGCSIPQPPGWCCTRPFHESGPCACVPVSR